MSEERGVNSRIVKIVLLALLAVALIVLLVMYLLDKGALPALDGGTMQFEQTGTIVRYDMDSRAQFHTYKDGGGFFSATKDGIRFIAGDGSEKMNSAYSMASPKLVGKGGVVGVAEPGGLSLYVFDKTGLLYVARPENPILHFSVAANGYACVVTQTGNDYDIFVYNDKGLVSLHGFHADTNVYPVAADVSNDGRILAVSYLDTNGAEINSRIVFSYINKSEAAAYAASNGIYGGSEQNPDRLIGVLRFMEGNQLIAVSDKDIVCYEADNGGRRKWSLTLGNMLDAICLTESNWFAVAYGSRNPNLPGEEPGLCRFYDLDGSPLGEFNAAGKVTQLSLGFSSAIVGSEHQLTALSQSGNTLWTYAATQDLLQVLFLENTNKVLIAGETQAEVLRRAKVRQAADAADSTPFPADVSTPNSSAEPTPLESPAPTDPPTTEEAM